MSIRKDIHTAKIMIHATPWDPDPGLKREVLERIRLITGAASAHVFLQDLDRGVGDVGPDVGCDPIRLERFRRPTGPKNVLFEGERGMHFNPGRVLCSHDFVPDQEMESSDFYREVLNPLFYLMAVPLGRDGTRLKGLGVHRERRQGPFGERERRIMQELVPCLLEAEAQEQAQQVVTLASAGKAALFDSLSTAFVIVDPDGYVIDLNSAACEILSRCEGLLLACRSQVLATPSAAKTTELLEMVRAATCSGQEHALTLGRTKTPTLRIRLRATRQGSDTFIALELSLAGQHDELEMLDEGNREIVGLLVTTRLQNKEIAERLAVSVAYIEKHIEQIANKLGIHVSRGHRVRGIMRQRFGKMFNQ